jgi:hypothetical protein
MRRHWFFLAPAAILGILLFAFIGGESREAIVELAAAAALWLAPDYLLASVWTSGAVPDPLRRTWMARFRSLEFPPSHGRGVAERVAERSEHMTPEERERFRQGMRGRCGFDPSTSESKSNEPIRRSAAETVV